MRTDTAPKHTAIRLADYTPPVYLPETVSLAFDLYPQATRVKSEIVFRLNANRASNATLDLMLDGEKLNLIAASIDGTALDLSALIVTDSGLTVPASLLPDGDFTWQAEVEIDPESNKALEGVYTSNGMYCTQCEAEGFRKITYFPDRPDAMAVYTVRMEADPVTHPVLLSNGELVNSGKTEKGRHWALWHDPHPKPAYLFALVAGDLKLLEDSFTTCSGKDVALQIYVRPGDEDKIAYAMDALKRSMRWDEEAYGREYDLPLFMIVAVDDFNMGAMENKGLNIFNTRLVLASPETATDANYLAIESVIAHEYFHNWTGNRITCRDWFQLCLKEGLTVFRDQQFSEDMRSPEVLRIKEVGMLRGRQFREDAGPLAHPVRPEEYIEINNFYTATVYEKGAEVVRMLHTLVGAETYRKALDLYFDRHDGQACTIEDFAACFEETSSRDLTQFKRWWSQAGTPRVSVELEQDGNATLLHISQSTSPTPGQDSKQPLHIPFAVGFLGTDGTPLRLTGPDGEARDTHIIELTAPSETIRFEGAAACPIPSLLRGFSAPVILSYDRSDEERALLLAHDNDAFNRWEAGRDLALNAMLGAVASIAEGDAPVIPPTLPQSLRIALERGGDPAFLALLLGIPGEDEVAAHLASHDRPVDPDAIHAARAALHLAIAHEAQTTLLQTYADCHVDGPYSPDAADAGKRALRNRALFALVPLGRDVVEPLAAAQFENADNMTDTSAALEALAVLGGEKADAALDAFAARWQGDGLVMDKWVSLQARMPRKDALERVKAIRARDDIDWRNPNRFRSLVGSFAANHWRFHAADGSGYRFFAEQLEWLDGMNPQTTARMSTAFETWRRYDVGRQATMRGEMERLIARTDCSRDLYEILKRLLG